MQENHNLPMQEIMRMAQSSAGQQLLSLLQEKGGSGLQHVISKAMTGDYDQAKQVLSDLLQDPDAQKLLDELGK